MIYESQERGTLVLGHDIVTVQSENTLEDDFSSLHGLAVYEH